ncbi:hypothetical protein [Arcanobacterium phocae]|uniref:Uncharacterized protein n=1 Tax=Arcanobacterium phocae TaxID=131112 RepID=A0A1H2LA50_9ACTO|nr:hypothetical protein [Arcanobacterium phocae]SDU77927.1 hypothetical protein SAMN04489737_0240 [Arcanobacterium phocae]
MSSSNPHAMRDAVALGLGITIYYASPDFIRSRPMRFVVKTLSCAIPATFQITSEKAKTSIISDADLKDSNVDLKDSDQHQVKPHMLAIGGALVAGSLGMSILTERAIFRRGERRRAEGKRLAHSQLALVGGISAGIVSYLSDRFDD